MSSLYMDLEIIKVTDFSIASEALQKDMAEIKEKYPHLLENAPEVAFSQWEGGSNNCYNFALNRWSNDFLIPGRVPFVRGQSKEEYFDSIKKGALKDGLRPLSNSFASAVKNLKPDEHITALFLGYVQKYGDIYRDFHWISLRKEKEKIIWAHKLGDSPAMRIMSGDIFERAANDRYEHFAGYWAVPEKLQKPPPPLQKCRR